MKKITWLLLFGFVFVLLTGCVVTRPAVAPPPLKKEVRTAKPGPNYIWISGHWKWTGGKYVWATGHWTKARKGMSWVPGHWERRGRHWVYVKGHWRRK